MGEMAKIMEMVKNYNKAGKETLEDHRMREHEEQSEDSGERIVSENKETIAKYKKYRKNARR